jgi:hypothetical protein
MTIDELEQAERREMKLHRPREIKRLIPVDSHSQLDTGYTGRPLDTKDPENKPMSYGDKLWRRGH